MRNITVLKYTENVMRTKRHWEECKTLPSYFAAQRLALHLKEVARDKGYDPRGIKVLSKEQSHGKGRVSDSEVQWTEGPDNWPAYCELIEYPGVWIESHNVKSISFYDIIQHGMKGCKYENNQH
jgi:hypothetical protein